MSTRVSFETAKMPELFNTLNVSELKLVFVIIHYLTSKGKNMFINNADNREYLATMGFKRTPVRISNLLSSLVHKKMLNKEGFGVYSIPEGLFYLPEKVSISSVEV